MADGKPGRRGTLAKNAEKVHPSLTPEEGYVRDTHQTETEKPQSSSSAGHISQIIVDALWLLLNEVEGITKEEIHEMMTRKPLRDVGE